MSDYDGASKIVKRMLQPMRLAEARLQDLAESDSDEQIHSPKSPKEDESQEKEETGGSRSRRSVRISTLFSCVVQEAETDTDTTVGVTNQTNQGILGKRSERSGSGSIACFSTEPDTMSIQIENAFVTAPTTACA